MIIMIICVLRVIICRIQALLSLAFVCYHVLQGSSDLDLSNSQCLLILIGVYDILSTFCKTFFLSYFHHKINFRHVRVRESKMEHFSLIFVHQFYTLYIAITF